MKLHKLELQTKAEIYAALTFAAEQLQQALDDYNSTVDDAFNDVTAALDAFNAAAAEAQSWCEGQAADIQADIDERSEQWQESDKGQAVIAWQQQFDGIDFPTVEVDEPRPLEADEDFENYAEMLNDLPEESE